MRIAFALTPNSAASVHQKRSGKSVRLDLHRRVPAGEQGLVDLVPVP
jgi:hypothetical protein